MTYRWRGRSTSELFAAITFAGFLVGFVFYLCVGNFQRAKSAAQRQARRRRELEEQKRKLVYSPESGDQFGSGRRRINFGAGNTDSPRSGYSGSSSMYTDDKGETVGVGGVVVEGSGTTMLLGGDARGGGSQLQFGVPQQRVGNATAGAARKQVDLLDTGPLSPGEMSV
mmetsp:Transcript_30351/g.72215  ORF Transcript_30351/g.72215 Transcript_30351/m.72215 type:complete len:169 (+) Transcript_30351:547-1053(+)